MSCAFDKDIVDKMAQADLDREINQATVLESINIDELAEAEMENATESAPYMARECGNCHNIMYITPHKATNQVFDGEGWILCNCGAPAIGPMLRGYWTP